MSSTIARVCARVTRPIAAATLIVALAVASLVPVVFATPAAAVQSTGGTARFPYVQWISWGANGTDLTPNASGNITTSETIDLNGQQIVVTCTINNLARTRGSDTVAGSEGKLIESYSSGQWRGDGLDDLYNIGGSGTNNTMAVGIKNIHNANTVDFDFNCSADLVVGSTHTPVKLAGLVMASAESSVNASSFWEYVGATIPNTGTWRILDRVRGADCAQDNYARSTTASGTKTLLLYGAKNTDCEASASPGRQPNPMSVAFMDGVSSATNVTLAGRGNEAIALGVVVAMDFGDAPASYGTAGALGQGGFTGGEPTAYTSGDGQGVFTMSLANQTPPVLRLGSALDFEGNEQPSATANGDDTNGTDDEDGVTLASSYAATPGSTVTVSGIQCNASAAQPGYVAGWIDFNADGVFQASEKSTSVACPSGGGTVSVNFTAPGTAPPLATQPSFARFRIAPAASDLAATGVAPGGEVEDYPITVTWPPKPSIAVTKTPQSATFVVGDAVKYDVKVTNTGNVPLANVTVTEDLVGASFTTSCASATLAPYASKSCVVTYTATQADVDAGSITNKVHANGKDPSNVAVTEATATATVTSTAAPKLTVTKTVKSGTPGKVGDPVVWTVSVKNSGNVTLTNVTVTDALAGATIVTPCGFSTPISTLAPNATVSCDVSYAVKQADVDSGSVTNSATATGKPPFGANVTDTGTNKVTITPGAALEVTKTVKSGAPAKAGDPVVWTLTVKNSGNVTLTNVSVTDALSGATIVTPCGFSTPIASLAPSASVSCDVSYSVTQGDVDSGSVTNSATATGKPPVGANVTGTGTNKVTITPAAAVDLTKTLKSGAPTKAGDPVVWTVTVKNTGNVTLTNVTVTDALSGATIVTPCGFSSPIATLAPNASVSCDVSYSVTQANVDAGSVTNTASVSGKPPVGANVTDADSNKVTITPAAALDVTKVLKAGAPIKAGDPVTWTVTVKNTGNVTLTNVTVTDALSGATIVTPCGFSSPIATLAPGASVSCDVSYSVKQSDVDAGSVTNTASGTGKPPVGANVTDSDLQTVLVGAAPKLDVTKTLKSGTPAKAGDPVVWTVTVKNSGNVTLTNVTVTDALSGATVVTPCGFSSPIASMAPAATVSCDVAYSVTQANVDAGNVTNTANAAGKPPVGANVTGSDSNSVTIVPAPSIDLTKTWLSGAPTKAGDPITWTVTVKNTGNVSLTNVNVTDSLAGASFASGCAFASPISLTPGQSGSCVASYAVTQANVDAGSVTNNASVSGKPPVGANVTDSDANSVTITPAAALDVTKTVKSGSPVKAGDPVVWTVTVKNTGNVTLTNVGVTDALSGATIVTPCGFSAPIATLAPSASVACDVSYSVTQTNVDAGSVTNSATATGKPPVGANVTSTGTNKVTITPAAAVDVTKTVKSGSPAKAGDPVVWTVTVKNTGNVTLTNVTVTDALSGATVVTPCGFSSPISTLAPNASVSCDVSYAVTQANVDAGSVTNTASATGKPPVGANVTDSDSKVVTITPAAAVDVTKTLKTGSPVKAGDPVVWTVTVKNTGNVTLTNVTVTDALSGATVVTPCAFSSPIATMAPGATASCDVSYSVTQANVDAGSVTNSASATGKPPVGANVTDSDSNAVTIAPAGAVDVTKMLKTGAPTKAGDPVTWTVTVKNTGNVTLTNVTVTDALSGATIVTPCAFSSPIASMAPGATASCDVSYSVTQANVDAGSVTNSASATGKPPVGANVTDSDSNTVTITPAAAIDVTKTLKTGAPSKAGDPVTWTVTVKNTGNVTLTNVTVTDALSGATIVTPCAFSSPIATMAPNASASCDLSYSVTQGNVDAGSVTNTASATGKPPVGANVTDSDSNTVTITPAAAVDVTKTLKTGAPTKAGDPVTWTVTVKNTGNVTLTNVTITDALGGATIVTPCAFSSPIASLAPNGSVSCDVSYAVKQSDVDAGSVTNSATATGKPPVGANVTSTATNKVTITPAAAIDITKTLKTGAPVTAGDPVAWTVTVKNTGNVTLTNVAVTDALSGATIVTPCAFSSPISTLAAGSTVSCDVSYSVTQTDVDAGSATNTASVTGKPPVGANVTDSDFNTVLIGVSPKIAVTKTLKTGLPVNAGDPVTWTVTVKNTGNVTLSNVAVTDALSGATIVTPCGFSSPIALLAPNASVSCDVSYSVSQANVDAGSVTNAATATGKPPVGANVTDTGTNTVTITPAPALALTKTWKAGAPVKAGDPVTWTVMVKNTGNVTLTNVKVTDALSGATIVTPCGFSAPIASLAPNASVSCDVSYSVTQANVDAGSVTNTASATGKPPVGANVTGSDSNQVTITPAAAIDVTKTLKTGAPTKAGDPVVWTVTVKNTGDVTLSNVTVTDALSGATIVTPCGFSAPVATLAPNASVSCDVSYSVTQGNVDAGSVTNTASATGKPPVGANVTDSDSNKVTITSAAAIDVTKTLKAGAPTKAGDSVTWTVTVKNTGNVTLTNVTVADGLSGATVVTPCGFSSPIATMAPNASVSCDVSYSVTQANVDAGSVTNNASVSGKPPVGPNVTDSDANKVTIAPAAAVEITKTLKTGAPVKAGDSVTWTVTAKNTGNVTLTNVTVSDALSGATIVTPCGFTSPISTLAPNAFVSCDVTYAVKQSDVDAGSVTNTASASGKPPVGPDVTDSDSNKVTITPAAAIDVAKTIKSGAPTKAGDPVVWTVTAKNTGDVTLTNVTVSDALSGATIVTPCAFSSPIASMAPNASVSCDVTYSVTQANVDAGSVTNTASATGKPPVGANVTDSDSNKVTITPAAAVDVTKTLKTGAPTKAGDPVTWTVTVKNTGNVTLSNVTVTDALSGATIVTPCGFSSPIATMAPNASVSCDVSYAVKQSDVDAGSVTNAASATGKPPVGANVTDSDSNKVTITPAAAVDITKALKTGAPAKAGDPVTWTVTVKNTGNVTLTNVTVTDALSGATIVTPCAFSSPIASMAPNASVSCDVAYSVTQANVDAGSVTNTASATGKPPVGANVTDSDSNEVTITPAAAVDVTKTLKTGAPTKSGDPVVWTVTVKNTGNVTLTDVTVADVLNGNVLTFTTPCGFSVPIASLAPTASISCDVAYAITQTDVDAGSVTNAVTATGKPPVGGTVTGNDHNTVPVGESALVEVTKTLKSGAPTKAGDPVVWTVTVKNTGNVTLTNVTTTDALNGATFVTPCGFSAPISSLAPSAAVSCDVTYAVKQSDVDAGSVKNTATAIGTSPKGVDVTDSDANTVTITPAAALHLTKTLKSGAPTKAGDAVTWTVTVKNTGNVTLTNVTVTDALGGATVVTPCGFSSPIASLAPNGSVSCDVSYAVTQADVDASSVTNSASATGRPPVGADVTDSAANTVTISSAAALDITKTLKTGAPAKAGDPVTWTVTVQNTGNVTLTNVTVTDALSGATIVTPCAFSSPIASMAPNGSVSCDVSYAVKQSDVDAGSVTNTASATGKPPVGANVTDSDSNKVTITPAAAVDITKTLKTGLPVKAGDSVVWTVTVKNTGNVTLTNVTVTDALSGATIVTPCAFSSPIASMAPSASVSCDVTYSMTQANVDAGSVTNTASATGKPPVGANVTDSDSNKVTITPAAAVDVTKTLKTGAPAKAGDLVTWTVTVKNTGNVTLTNVTVTDALSGATTVTPCGFSSPIASLAPNGSISCDVTYAVKQSDVDAGSVTNTASATGKPPVGANVTDSDSNKVTITPAAAVDITKALKTGAPTKAGDPVTWTVTVKNTGNVTLTNVTVTDALTGATIVTPCAFSSPIASMAPNASVSCDVSYSMKQSDVDAGSVTNVASATGKPPVGANVTDSDSNTVTITPAAALDVTKALKTGAPAKAGDPVTWTVTVKNTGNVTLTNVTVTDALSGATIVTPCGFSSPIASLAPNAAVSCDVSYAVKQADVDAGSVTNVASATGKPPVGANVTDSDSNKVTITPAAQIEITKVLKAGAPTKAGDPVTWTVTVKNTGNVTLSNVTVTDAMSGATIVTPCAFSSPIATMAPNASASCDVSYSVTQGNVDAGSVTNSASATGKPPVGPNVTDSDSNKVTIPPAAQIEISKTLKAGAPTKAADPVTWTVTVKNTGNVTLSNVTVTDALSGATIVAPCDFSSPIASLAPNAAVSCDVSYSVAQADVDAGSVKNTASAVGTSPKGVDVNDSDANTVTIAAAPAIGVTKAFKIGTPVIAGDPVKWTVTVKNTGNVTLTNVTVIDALPGATFVAPCGFASPIATFTPNATMSCDVTYAIKQADVNAGSVKNTVTATGKPPVGLEVTDTAVNTVPIGSTPLIEVTKTLKSGTPNKAGDPVVWTVSVKNSGNVTLSNVTVTDELNGATLVTPCGFASPIASMSPAATVSCDVAYSVTQSDVDAGSVTNTASVTGKPPVGANVTDSDSNKVTITPAAAIAVTKTLKLGTPAKSGDPVRWTVTVKNTGNVTLSGVTVTDELAGATFVAPCDFASPIATLAPNASVTCDVTYSVKQADVDKGSVKNTASAVGTSPKAVEVNDTDDNTVTIAPAAAIHVTKTVKSGSPTKAGDPVVWTVTVENTGNVTLSEVTVTDQLAGATLVAPCDFASPIPTLAPNTAVSCDFSYLVKQTDVDAGSVTNTAAGIGTTPKSGTVTDDAVSTAFVGAAPAIHVTKTLKTGAPTKAGDPVTWTVTVKNTGNVTLTNVTVTDALSGATIVAPCDFSSPIASMAPNASVSCDVSYSVKQANVDAGSVTNTASATGKPPVGANVTDSDSNKVTITPAAAVDVTKTLKTGAPTKAGDPVTWTVTVKNTGNVTLTNVTVTDALSGATVVTPCAFSSPIASMAPNASFSCDVTYSVTQANVDAGSVTNTASATGKPPSGANVTDSDSNTVTITPAAAIDVTKTLKTGAPSKAGDPVTWTVTVKNTGSVTLTNVTVTDALSGATIVTPCAFSSPIATMAPNASVTCDVTYSVQQADVDKGSVKNTASAVGTSPKGVDVNDSDSNTVTIAPAAAIHVAKTLKTGAPTKAGDPVTWTVTVKNTGNVTLSEVTVSDELAGATFAAPCDFATPIDLLAPGATASCDVSYSVTQPNVNSGSVTNSATASGLPPAGDAVTDEADSTVPIGATPLIDVTKTWLAGAPTKAGDSVSWTVTVKNTGTVTLTNVAVSDSLSGATFATGCAFASPITLTPGDSASCVVSYSVTQGNVDAGSITNNVAALGTPPVGDQVHDADANMVPIGANPSIDVTKTLKLGTPAKSGDPVTWTVTVKNTGNVTLGGVTVTDELASATFVAPCDFASPIATLAPNASVTCDVTYSVKQADVDKSSVKNTASAVGTSPKGVEVNDSDDNTVTIAPAAAIHVTKTVKSGSPTKAGDPVVWTVTVENTGNVTLADVSVTDALAGATFAAPCDFATPIDMLAPGGAVSCDVEYAVVQADVNAGFVTNTATATGTPPEGDPVSDSGESTATVGASPQIEVVKTNRHNAFNVDVPALFDITVTNVGNIPVEQLELVEDLGGATFVTSCDADTLDIGDSTSCVATYTPTSADWDAGSFTNSVTATAHDVHNTVVTDSGSATMWKDAFAVSVVTPVCNADVPSLQWNLVLPDGFPVSSSTPVTITWVNPHGDDYVLENQPLTGTILWPGASAGTPRQWPGWERHADGLYYPTTGNFAWTRNGVQVKFKVNPETTVTAYYPDATPTCATGPTTNTAPAPEIAVVKTAQKNAFNVGVPALFDVKVTNTGEVPVKDLTLVDDLAGATMVTSCDADTLAVGDSTSCVASYSPTDADWAAGTITNTVTATAKDAQEVVVTATATASMWPDRFDSSGTASVCLANMPYLDWDFVLPAGFPVSSDTPMTITWINPNGENYVVKNQPLKGSRLWPGASTTDPMQWPGWELGEDGVYVQTDGNYAWTRNGVDVVFSVNPQSTETVHYPAATADCDPKPPTGSLSFTGADVGLTVGAAGALLLGGILFLLIARRSRRED